MSDNQLTQLKKLQVELDSIDLTKNEPESCWPTPSESDVERIKQLLGRIPEGLLGVARYNERTGEPSVLAVRPFVRGQPFPTTYWMCDPLLREKISEIEINGFIKELEQQIIPNDKKLEQSLLEDNLNYIRNRWSLLSAEDASKIKESAMRTLRQRGIGGIFDFRNIRCLHMHYAYHLIHGSSIGAILDDQFGLREFA